MNLFWKIWITYQYRNSKIKPLKYLRFLQKSQWWDREQLDSHILMKMRELIGYAISNTGYYKELLNNLDLNSFSLKELKKIPILSKEIVRERPGDLRSKETDLDYVEASTSGSSGIPLKVYRSKEASAIHMAGHYRFHDWWGVNPGDRHVIIWGVRQTKKRELNIIKRLKNILIPPPLVINVFDLNEDTIDYYIKQIIKFNPKYIRGYVSSIKQFYQLAGTEKIDISNLQPKVIITTSEVLSPHDRAIIEGISGCRVANEYGSRDGGQFAYECPEGGMHIQEEYQYFWTGNDKELIGTELNNSAMPLINYPVGDRVVISDKLCSCGRSLKVLAHIEGRSTDLVKKPDGSFISSWIFHYIINELNDIEQEVSIKQFKVIQRNNHFDFFILKDRKFSEKVTTYIKKRMIKLIGDGIDVSFRFPDQIKKEESGKLRYFVRIS